MKLSDIKGEQAIDILADIVEPITDIFSDEKVAEAWRKKDRAKAVSVALKNHKKQVLYVLATLDGEDPKEYQPSLLSVPAKMLDLLNDPEISELFPSQGQKEDEKPSGSATGNTKETEKK